MNDLILSLMDDQVESRVNGVSRPVRITRDENKEIPDLRAREYVYLVPILVFIVLIGVYPMPLLERMEPSVKAVVERIDQARERRLASLGLSSVFEEEKQEKKAGGHQP
ncbi:hypothetical protein ACFLU6_13640 [Acidobacteriota bacterium]